MSIESIIGVMRIVEEPGNGTRYNLIIVPDGYYLRVIWADIPWMSTTTRTPGDGFRTTTRGPHATKLAQDDLSSSDHEAMKKILDTYLRRP